MAEKEKTDEKTETLHVQKLTTKQMIATTIATAVVQVGMSIVAGYVAGKVNEKVVNFIAPEDPN